MGAIRLFDEILFFIYAFKSAKYTIKGKCKACGKCCRNLVFKIGDDPVRTEEEFERIKKFDKRYEIFYSSNAFGENGEMLFTCKYLSKNGKCKIHPFRSFVCRNYPKINSKFFSNGGKLLEGCGYTIEPNKKFKEFLND